MADTENTRAPAAADERSAAVPPAHKLVPLERAIAGLDYFLNVKEERRFIEGARNELRALAASPEVCASGSGDRETE